MTKTKSTTFALLLAASIAAGVAGAAALSHEAENAFALDTSSNVTYPYETGKDSFKNATYLNVSEGGTGYETFEITFDKVTDFTSVKYVAVQLSINDLGAANKIWLGMGFFSQSMGGCAYWDVNDRANRGDKVYFQTEAGTISEVFNYELEFNQIQKGTLWIPIESLSTRSWDGTPESNIDKTKIKSLYGIFQANVYYGWEIQIGSISVYEGEPDTAEQKMINDCSKGERKSGHYLGGSPHVTASFNSEKEIPEPEPPAIGYPFRTGEEAEYYTATWTGFVPGDSEQNLQTVKVSFDSATADFSQASYLIVQYKADGAPGIQFRLNEGTKQYTVKGNNDARIYFAAEGATTSQLSCRITYDHANITPASTLGAVIIPMDSMSWSGTAGDLSKIDSISLETNSQYNGSFSLLIGEIGMYTGEPGNGGTFTKLLTLDEAKNDKFVVSTQRDYNQGRLIFNEGPADLPITQLGDASVDFNANKKVATDFAVWNQGGQGLVEMTKDSYGLDAVKITPKEVPANNDQYMATTLSNGGFSWANKKGVSLWARNDSDVEITFNIEIDCKKNGVSDRFNIQHGNRFSLYDVRTGKSYIYMTRSTVTLPVGFEGWIRIPFTAFSKADWSNNGFDPSEFMQEGTTVSYLAVTTHVPSYVDKSFSVNLFGAYETEPSFNSAFMTGNSIYDLMELENLELVEPVATTSISDKVDLIPANKEEN